MRLGVNTLFLVPDDVGGTETYLRESLRASVESNPEDEFVLFTNNENDQLFRDLLVSQSNVSCMCLNFKAAHRPNRIILEQTKLPVAARKHNLDLLWSPGYTAPFFAPCPQVVTVHDLQYKTYPEDMSRLERLTLDFLVRGSCRRCEAVLAISEFSRQELIKYRIAEPDRVHVVLEGVDPSFGDHADHHERQTTLADIIPFEVPYILCVAHTYPHKMVHVLVEAFAAVMDSIPHNLLLVGKARRGEDLVQKTLKTIDGKNRVIRLQKGLDYRVLQMVYQSADIFVLPSAYEGFGLPVLEAMMAGVPVVTTREAALAEVAGPHSFRADAITSQNIAAKIMEVVALDQQKRDDQVNKARRWAQEFTWHKSAQQMFEVFRSVVREQSDQIDGPHI